MSLKNIIDKLLLTEDVSIADINDVIDNHKRVIINYHTRGEDEHTGARVVEFYAYGLTKAGNPVLRGFQPYGDTTSRVPSWKFFRVDRISYWHVTGQTFNHPADFYYKGLGDFNPNGDDTMKTVFKVANFDDNNNKGGIDIKTPHNGPKLKSDNGLYKTDTEKKMERMKQQLQKPINLSDIKIANGFSGKDTAPNTSGPKKKSDDNEEAKNNDTQLYRTDTERGMEQLRKQLENPKKIDLEQLRKKLGDTSEPISYSDLNKRLNKNIEDDSRSNLYRTDTERGMEQLRKQLENPKKIDLEQLRKK